MSNAKKLRKLALFFQAIGLLFSVIFYAQKKKKLAYSVSLLGGASCLCCLNCARTQELKELEALYQEPQSFDCDGEEWEEQVEQ